jgi:integrase
MGAYQYKREPLTGDAANQLFNACTTHLEQLIIWTFLDTGLRVSELATLKRTRIDWQTHRLTIYGRGGTLREPLEATHPPTQPARAGPSRRTLCDARDAWLQHGGAPLTT